jgi:hypothetical protein
MHHDLLIPSLPVSLKEFVRSFFECQQVFGADEKSIRYVILSTGHFKSQAHHKLATVR